MRDPLLEGLNGYGIRVAGLKESTLEGTYGPVGEIHGEARFVYQWYISYRPMERDPFLSVCTTHGVDRSTLE